jgi:uncharacterized protein YcnI
MNMLTRPQIIFLALAAILPSVPALAHVTIEPKEAPAGSYAKLVFRIPHGCDGSPTTKITIQIPDGVLSVKPQVHLGWEIGIKKRKLPKPIMLHDMEITESVAEVSWSGGSLPDEYMDEVGMSVKLPQRDGAKLLFPVTQDCKKGSMHWTSVTASGHGEHAAQLPAPALSLTKSLPSDEHHHH